MQEAAIRFQFPDAASAKLAFDTLQELGYTPVFDEDSSEQADASASSRILHVHVDNRDLTSAFEIAEAFGGQLIEEAALTESSIMNAAYGLDMISIPAHLVNEDWVDNDNYVRVDPTGDDLSHRDEEAFGWHDDEDTTNHFEGGIHM
ncbi:DNA/RNA helicase [Paenibacillus sp. 481]|uniref:DNA/RNA helicase n=1 Tax=Paenibacillus sp. 481 TaxID=2835869 RepID=UPI001E5D9A96|nr:DNA/RNA helicase [Paenibacillus sp. 481]UHA74932.1 DNA/RNA helicase [Paenibacillus sp. 481]